MSKHRKPGAQPDDLLDELSSLQSLLGDAARDVPFSGSTGVDDDDIPLLPPEKGDSLEGDTANQIPLLDPAPGEDQDRQAVLRQAAMARENPFLAPSRPASTPPTEDLERRIARRAPANPDAAAGNLSSDAQAVHAPAPSPAPAPAGNAPSSALADHEIRALVDELLAQWLPRIERELRDRLMEELRQRRD